jgi:Uma2 family endonuclease
MNIALLHRMTADEFLRWDQRQESGRFELEGGRVVVQQAQNFAHLKAKGLIYERLKAAIAQAKAPLFAMPDGATVRVDDTRVYEPDALVAHQPEPPPETIEIPDVVVVVEIVSPSSEKRDYVEKARGYAAVASIAHYVIVDPAARTVHHHTRATLDARSEPVLVRESFLRLDPPGLTVDLVGLFASV